jgi:D-alanine-D-alanine ligase
MKVLVLFDLPRPVDPNQTFTLKALREEEDRPTEADVITSLKRLGHEVQTLAVYDDILSVVQKIHDLAPDVVFNLCESFLNDRAHEPNVPALLELLKLPYTGAGPEGLLLCKDKALAKTLLSYHHIRMAHFVVSRKQRPLRRITRLKFPVFVKPAAQESSEGIVKASFARNESDALERARFIHQSLNGDALIEEYVDGRELYVSLMGTNKVTVFPIRELFFEKVPEGEPKFAHSKAKWDGEYRWKWGIKNGPAAELPPRVEKKLVTEAKRIYMFLKICGLGRIDMRLTPDNELVFIEANPNPSLAESDDFARSAATAGLSYDTLIQRIIDAAKSGG